MTPVNKETIMFEELVKQVYHISKQSGKNEIAIITNHLKIKGTIFEDNDHEKKHEGTLTLTNAKIWRLEDICNCNAPDCNCNEANFCAVEWLHVNAKKIVAFSVV